MRELDLTQSQYEAIRDALIAQDVVSAAAGRWCFDRGNQYDCRDNGEVLR